MTKIQIDIPEDINNKLRMYMVKNGLKNKKDALIKFLKEKL